MKTKEAALNVDKKDKGIARKLKNMGPAAIITSAFVGPGTITAATVAGVNFGYELLWAVGFSVISLLILMEMSSRIGIVGKKNFMEASIAIIPDNKVWKYFVNIVAGLSVVTVAFAFEAGNIIGSSLGLGDILGINQFFSALIVGSLALSTVFLGSAKVLEKIMLTFVSLMGLMFVITMIVTGPNILSILSGLFIPSVPEGGAISTIALIGTTIIGINLILHSITSKNKWNQATDMGDAKFDILVNVLIGGLITLSIVITSATVLFGSGVEVNSPLVFSMQLEPVLGSWARIVGGLGIFAAGLSSAIAVPFTLQTIFGSLFNWEGGRQSSQAKVLGTIAVVFGTVLAMLDARPVQIITTAQVTSGFTLPLIAILLVLACNNKKVLGEATNTLVQNILGVIAAVVSLGLGSWGLFNVFMNLFG